MIKSFRNKDSQKIFHGKYIKSMSRDLQRKAFRKLIMLSASTNLNDLRVPPSNRLEKLSGNRKFEYSMRINDQWRICFEWLNNDAWNVIIEDYH